MTTIIDYKDKLPIDEVLNKAKDLLSENGFTPLDIKEGNAAVWFTFTCEGCGQHCMTDEPNKLPKKSTCNQCGHKMTITKCGFIIGAKPK